MNTFVVIRDNSAGNEAIGEMWQETKIFSGDSTLEEVMQWACDGYTGSMSRKHVQITRPHEDNII